MRPELQNKLYEKYPKIFAQKDWPMTQTAMCWHFECSDGWYDLIDSLCSEIQAHIDNENWSIQYKRESGKLPADAPDFFQVEATQVKEKFGGLRFYVNYYDDYIRGLISMAETISYKTCETCGLPGKPNDDGWIATLCETCRDAYEKKWLRRNEEAREKLTVKMNDVTVAP